MTAGLPSALDVPCPECGAEPGRICHSHLSHLFHPARVTAAVAADDKKATP